MERSSGVARGAYTAFVVAGLMLAPVFASTGRAALVAAGATSVRAMPTVLGTVSLPTTGTASGGSGSVAVTGMGPRATIEAPGRFSAVPRVVPLPSVAVGSVSAALSATPASPGTASGPTAAVPLFTGGETVSPLDDQPLPAVGDEMVSPLDLGPPEPGAVAALMAQASEAVTPAELVGLPEAAPLAVPPGAVVVDPFAATPLPTGAVAGLPGSTAAGIPTGAFSPLPPDFVPAPAEVMLALPAIATTG